ERLEVLLHAQRTGARSAGAVRGRERLVHVDVHTVDAEVSGTRDPEERVHVRAVSVHEAARGVHGVADLPHAFFEEAERVRVREHEATTSSPSAARSASRSTLPRASLFTVVTSKPHIA